MRLGLKLPKFVKITHQCTLYQQISLILSLPKEKSWQQTRFSLDKNTLTFYPINCTRTENYKANSKDLIQPNRLIFLFGKSQIMFWGQAAVNLQTETLITHGPKPTLKRQIPNNLPVKQTDIFIFIYLDKFLKTTTQNIVIAA